ncbi:hypothetical protein CHISP_2454 [Chitinispirillum alkaliphilum]|nr:hypothetical protein CHISP_2454 [Chitinispirillum alkaliphilum]
MVVWIKRISTILAGSAFFITLLISIDFSNLLDTSVMFSALIKSFFAASLFWFCGFVIADVLLKGVIDDIPNDPMNLLEGGLLQHIHNQQVQNDPILAEMADAAREEKDNSGEDKGKKRK